MILRQLDVQAILKQQLNSQIEFPLFKYLIILLRVCALSWRSDIRSVSLFGADFAEAYQSIAREGPYF